MNNYELVPVYRAVGPKERELIEQSGWKQFPVPLPEKPIYYPHLSEEKVAEIAKVWLLAVLGGGYVVKFDMLRSDMEQHQDKFGNVDVHGDMSMPEEMLNDINSKIVGTIETRQRFIPTPTKGRWTHAATITEREPFFLEGLNIWDYKWRGTGERVAINDPLYNQPYSFQVYDISGENAKASFAAGEFSNGIWGIYKRLQY
jgi:hypothetical protein